MKKIYEDHLKKRGYGRETHFWRKNFICVMFKGNNVIQVWVDIPNSKKYKSNLNGLEDFSTTLNYFERL